MYGTLLTIASEVARSATFRSLGDGFVSRHRFAVLLMLVQLMEQKRKEEAERRRKEEAERERRRKGRRGSTQRGSLGGYSFIDSVARFCD